MTQVSFPPFSPILPHRTRIIATLGPASSDPAVIREMVLAGMEIARINLSHGSAESHRALLNALRGVSRELSRDVPVFFDLPGPKIRTGDLDQPLPVRQGDHVIFTRKPATAGSTTVPVENPVFFSVARPGATVSIGDGLLRCTVDSVSAGEVVCTALDPGSIGPHSGVVIAGGKSLPVSLTDADLAGLAFGIKEGVRIFGVSYVATAVDLTAAAEHARQLGADVHLIAKIERPEALEDLAAIIRTADAVMVARGDLGVQLPPEDLPAIQKRIIREANLSGTPVITATQMMESMTTRPLPTRAEVTDVANAILDGSDCVMLSGETAVGQYPVATVAMMARTASVAERIEQQSPDPGGMTATFRGRGIPPTIGDVISLAVTDAIRSLPVRLIATPTRTGGTPRRIARFRPYCPIIAFTRDQRTSAFLRFSRGVYPVVIEREIPDLHTYITMAIQEAGLVTLGDLVVLTEGRDPGRPGTDSLRIMTIR